MDFDLNYGNTNVAKKFDTQQVANKKSPAARQRGDGNQINVEKSDLRT
jgi:hypothetical protein